MKLLLVEDQPDLAESIRDYLSGNGYIVEQAVNYTDASEKISLYAYDVVLLDLTLPGGNGLDLLRQLKKRDPKTGSIIISAKNSLDDKITGLDLGADDYLSKPFHLAELNSRIRSVIRRRNFDGNTLIRFDNLKISPEERTVFVHDMPVELTRKEFDLLIYFISNQERVMTKENIAEHLWGDEMDNATSYDFIYSHVKNLRKKIMEKGGGDYIKTIYGIGYKFCQQ